MLFENVTLIMPDQLWPNGRLRVKDGLILELSPDEELLFEIEADEEIVDGHGCYLAPGFIDLHVHGALRHDTMEASAEAFSAILAFHAKGGTTGAALTTVATSAENILRVLHAARVWSDAQDPASITGSRLLGIHLEGPYFSPVKAGAHDPSELRTPRAEEYGAWLEQAEVITQMTLAPELEGAGELIRLLRENGITASGGHSDAWDEEARSGFAAGMHQVTHIFNAMSSARRRGPYRVAGLAEFALSEPGVRCEVIADGHHVSPTLLRMLYRAKGSRGICLVTDATAGAGLPEGESYHLGALECVVQGGVGLTADRSALAGSTSTMIRGVANLVRLADVPLVEAVRMAASNPASSLGIQGQCGRLAPGLLADLVLLSPELEVLATYVGGRCVYRRDG